MLGEDRGSSFPGSPGRSYLAPTNEGASQRSIPPEGRGSNVPSSEFEDCQSGPPPHLDLAVFTELPDMHYSSLILLSWKNPLRRLCRAIHTDKRFGTLVLILIVANSSLMFTQYTWPCPRGTVHPCSPKDSVGSVAFIVMEWFFTISFTIEMIIKIITLGFFYHPRSYLRFGWNVLDFTTVLASWLEIIGGLVPNTSVLRLLRVLRPLRTMSRVRGLRTLMGALFAAMPEIRDNIVLLGFLVLIFAILGVQVFEGTLHNRCLVTHGYHGNRTTPFLLPSLAGDNAKHCGGTLNCRDPQYAQGIPLDQIECGSDIDMMKYNPDAEIDDLVRDPLDYDNLAAAVLLVLKVFTGDDWPEDMNNLQNANSLSIPFIFFFLCIMVGGLFATNLFLAVLISAYYTNARKSEEDMQERKNKAMELWEQIRKGVHGQPPPAPVASSGPAALLMMKAFDDSRQRAVSIARNSQHGSPVHNIQGQPAAPPANPQQPRLSVSPAEPTGDLDRCFGAPGDVTVSLEVSTPDAHRSIPGTVDFGPARCGTGTTTESAPTGPSPFRVGRQSLGVDGNVVDPHTPRTGPRRQSVRSSASGRRRSEGSQFGGASRASSGRHSRGHRDSLGDRGHAPLKPTRTHRRPTFAAATLPQPGPLMEWNGDAPPPIYGGHHPSITTVTPPLPPVQVVLPAKEEDISAFGRLRKKVAFFILYDTTENFILFVTCFNVLVLAMDHYRIEEKPVMEKFMCYANFVCFIIFSAEITLKIFGLGFRRTFMDFQHGAGYNIFDLLLVLMSVPGVVSSQACQAKLSGSTFNAFRAFRMMRALRFLRRWPGVHALMKAFVSCLSEGVYVSLLLLLQIFIFGILGMQFFEGKFPKDPPFRQNFDTLWEAFLTTFVIITGDAWGAIMKEGMKAKGDAFCLYFLAVFLLGNYVLVNVFVAVILDKLDDATNELERSSVLLRVEGADHDCDGIYHPYPQGDHDLVWVKGGEEGLDDPNPRFLFSSDDCETGFWVIWHSEEREADEGYATSDVHHEQMPQEINHWRQDMMGLEWDENIKVTEVSEEDLLMEDERRLSFDALRLLDSNLGAVSDCKKVRVEVGSDLAESADVTFEGLQVTHVRPEGRAAREGVKAGWKLHAVNENIVDDDADARAKFAFCDEEEMVDLDFKRPPTEVETEADWEELYWTPEEEMRKTVTMRERCLYMPSVDLLGSSCVPRRSKFRQSVARLVNSYAFETTILAVIALNVLFLAVDHPAANDSLQSVLQAGDWFFTSVFLVEMILKILAMGFWHGQGAEEGRTDDELGAYFRDPWNCIDCFVVLTAIAALMPGAPETMKVFRSLRTLRLVIRSQKLRIVIEALVRTVPAVGQGLAVCAFIFFVFAILGCQLFKGTFYSCNDEDIEDEAGCTGMFNATDGGMYGDETVERERKWTNAPDHFDNVGYSLYTLIVVAIGEGWSEIMYLGIDAVGEGKSGRLNHSPVFSIYFFLFHVVGSFFCLNLIIGILISEFTNQRRELDGTQGSQLSEKQQSFIAAEKAVLLAIMFRERPKAPSDDMFGIRVRCFNVCKDSNFDRVVTGAIILNMVILATQHYQQPKEIEKIQNWGNWVCSVLFTAEAVIKLTGLGFVFYFRENWNRFDFTIVVVSLLGMFVPGLSGISAVRVLRVGRLFRLVEHAKGLQKLFNTMFQGDNLYYFGNIGVFCLAILFMFAVAGVSLFGTLEPHEGVDHNMNFHNVWNALITLFAIWTTEAWLDVRNGLVQNADDCGEPGYGQCGKGIIGDIYAVLFIIVGSVVVLNLFAAVVVELFDKQEAQERCSHEISAIQEFRERWWHRFGFIHIASEVTAQGFIDGITAHDTLDSNGKLMQKQGLIPNRLRRLPKKPPPGAPPSFMEEAKLPLKPTGLRVLTYLAAAAIPIRPAKLRSGSYRNAVVRYSDAAFCFAARGFGLQMDELMQVQECGLTRAPYVPENAFMLSHWYAVSLLTAGLRRLQMRKRRAQTPEIMSTGSGLPPLRKMVTAGTSQFGNQQVTNDNSVHLEVSSDEGTNEGSPEHQRQDKLTKVASAKVTPIDCDPADLASSPERIAAIKQGQASNASTPPQGGRPQSEAADLTPAARPPMPLRPPGHETQSDGQGGTPVRSPLPPPPPRPPSPRARVRALLTPISHSPTKKLPETKEQKIVAAKAANTNLRSELALLQAQLQSQSWAFD
eukprot:Hpha_TRINITY_DN16015_c5_g9::TRINITY_DN16015_c5_g9_i1::g.117144::m.117144